jgi:hypothetical protein
MMKLNLGHYELPRRAEQRVGEQCRHRQIWVIFPRSANGLATVNVTLFSDVPGCCLAGAKVPVNYAEGLGIGQSEEIGAAA